MHTIVQGIPVTTLAARRAERPDARRGLGAGPDDVVIVTVANFREKKDYPTLLAAAALLDDEPQIRFVAIGQGPLEGALREEHRRLDLGGRFRFLGHHPDPPAVLAGADIFVLTSRHEGLPIALLEAMALGVPPVATRVGGIPTVVTSGHDGILLAPGDPSAVAAALRRLAHDPDDRTALGEAAGRRAAAFDITTTQRALEAVYDRLALRH
jgi:glycosyltransferase involved in cell wall biosynthesis